MLVLADGAARPLFVTGVRRAEPPVSNLCPGAEAPAIPAKSPLKIADTVRTPPVSMRVRAASASRAAARCPIPGAPLMGQVEQSAMNGP